VGGAVPVVAVAPGLAAGLAVHVEHVLRTRPRRPAAVLRQVAVAGGLSAHAAWQSELRVTEHGGDPVDKTLEEGSGEAGRHPRLPVAEKRNLQFFFGTETHKQLLTVPEDEPRPAFTSQPRADATKLRLHTPETIEDS